MSNEKTPHRQSLTGEGSSTCCTSQGNWEYQLWLDADTTCELHPDGAVTDFDCHPYLDSGEWKTVLRTCSVCAGERFERGSAILAQYRGIVR